MVCLPNGRTHAWTDKPVAICALNFSEIGGMKSTDNAEEYHSVFAPFWKELVLIEKFVTIKSFTDFEV